MILWGFITQFLVGQSGWVAQAAGVFLSAVLLWDTLFRGQLGVSMCFLEEMYARHLGHLFVSPLRPVELVVANFLVSAMRVPIGVGGAAILAVPDLPLLAAGHAGLGRHPVLRGDDAVRLGDSADHRRAGPAPGPGRREPRLGRDLLHPALLRVYYPVRPCPPPVRWIAWLLPSAPVFEGMRTVLVEHRFDGALFAQAVAVLWSGWCWRRGLHAPVPERAPPRAAAAVRRVGPSTVAERRRSRAGLHAGRSQGRTMMTTIKLQCSALAQ